MEWADLRPRVQRAPPLAAKKGHRFAIGHTFGVRVQRPLGAKGHRLAAAGCVEGLWKKVLKMDGPSAQGFLSLTAAFGG